MFFAVILTISYTLIQNHVHKIVFECMKEREREFDISAVLTNDTINIETKIPRFPPPPSALSLHHNLPPHPFFFCLPKYLDPPLLPSSKKVFTKKLTQKINRTTEKTERSWRLPFLFYFSPPTGSINQSLVTHGYLHACVSSVLLDYRLNKH